MEWNKRVHAKLEAAETDAERVDVAATFGYQLQRSIERTTTKIQRRVVQDGVRSDMSKPLAELAARYRQLRRPAPTITAGELTAQMGGSTPSVVAASVAAAESTAPPGQTAADVATSELPRNRKDPLKKLNLSPEDKMRFCMKCYLCDEPLQRCYAFDLTGDVAGLSTKQKVDDSRNKSRIKCNNRHKIAKGSTETR